MTSQAEARAEAGARAPATAGSAPGSTPQTRLPGSVALIPTVAATVRSLLSMVVIALFLLTFVLQPFRIPSESMERTLLVGDFLLVNKRSMLTAVRSRTCCRTGNHSAATSLCFASRWIRRSTW